MAEERPEGHRRMRSLLRNYYGIAEDQKEQNVDPLSLDSSSFSKEKFVQKQLRSKKLSALVSTEVKLKRECENLDSEMKTLVYENYNKFISATDTIQQMRNHIDDMEVKMKELQSKILSIGKSSQKITDEFAENRKNIVQYSDIYSLLKKRQFLFELPSRLHNCIEMKAYAEAVRYYNKSKQILDKYKHLPSFGSIDKESMEIIENLKVLLKERMEKSSAIPQTVTECTQLLLELGGNSIPLRENFLEWRVNDLQSQLLRYKELPLPVLPPKAEPIQAPEPDIDDDIFTMKKELLSNDLDMLEDSPEETEKIATPEEIHFERTSLYLRQLNSGFLREMVDFTSSYGELFVESAEEGEQAELRDMFEERTEELFDNFTNLVRDHLLAQKAPGFVLQLLELLGDAFGTIGTKSVSAMNLGACMANLFKNTLISYMKFQLDRAISSMSSKIDVLEKFCPTRNTESCVLSDKLNSPSTHCNRLAKEMVSDMEGFIDSCSILLTSESNKSLKETFGLAIWDTLNKFVTEMGKFFVKESQRLAEEQQKARRKAGSGSPPAIFMCMLSKLVISLEENVVSKVESKLKDLFVACRNSFPASRISRIKPVDVEPFQNHLQNAAQRLLSEFVRDQGTHLSLLVQTGIDTPDWSVMKEPGDVHLAFELVVDELKSILQEVSSIFAFVSERESLSSSQVAVNRYTLDALHQLTGTAKRGSIIGGIIEFNTNAIVVGIAKIGVKSFIECVRLCTFNKFGYQQMQVDLFFMRSVWRQLDFDNENLVDHMLDDVLESTSWRCFELIPMGPKIIESICEKKLQKYQATIQ